MPGIRLMVAGAQGRAWSKSPPIARPRKELPSGDRAHRHQQASIPDLGHARLVDVLARFQFIVQAGVRHVPACLPGFTVVIGIHTIGPSDSANHFLHVFPARKERATGGQPPQTGVIGRVLDSGVGCGRYPRPPGLAVVFRPSQHHAFGRLKVTARPVDRITSTGAFRYPLSSALVIQHFNSPVIGVNVDQSQISHLSRPFTSFASR